MYPLFNFNLYYVKSPLASRKLLCIDEHIKTVTDSNLQNNGCAKLVSARECVPKLNLDKLLQKDEQRYDSEVNIASIEDIVTWSKHIGEDGTALDGSENSDQLRPICGYFFLKSKVYRPYAFVSLLNFNNMHLDVIRGYSRCAIQLYNGQ